MSQRRKTDLIPDRRKWPRIIVDKVAELEGSERILELAGELEWQLADVSYYGGELPPGLRPRGALTTRLPSDPFVKRLLKVGCPVVRIGHLPHPKDDLVPAVVEDRAAAGRLAAEHFAERGFRHVAYRGHIPWSDTSAIYDGLAARARELDMTCHLLRDRGGQGPTRMERVEDRRARTIEWLAALPKPVGFVGYGDTMAARVCTWCEQSDIAVPHDVAVLGYLDTVFTCESAVIPLSSIAIDHVRIVETAVALLKKLISRKRPRETCVAVPPKRVVVRASTDVLASHDPIVGEALRFIWDNLSKNLAVSRVAAQLGVSRRKLERAFREDLHRGVNQEVLRRRLERAGELLRTTDIPIADLAPQLGFGSRDYFQRVFRRAFGTSPGRYRRQHDGT